MMRYTVLSILALALAAGCGSTGGGEPDPSTMVLVVEDEFWNGGEAESSREAKNRIVGEMENRARLILGTSVRRFEDIRARCEAEIESIASPFEIEDVVPTLKNLYSSEEETYEQRIQEIMNVYLTELDNVIAYVIDTIWEVAFEVAGSEDVGAGYDTRTGIKDVDEIAEATVELVLFRAGRDEFVDDFDFQKRKRIGLSRLYKHDAKGRGRLALYSSDSLYRFHSERQDGIACAIVFHSELPEGAPLEIRQAVRNRITRGGANVFDSGFHWDDNAGGPEGRLPLHGGEEDADYLVSEVFLPRLNLDAPEFAKLHDYTALRDYKTAVVNAETGEVIDCVSWQLTWTISRNGIASVDKGSQPLLDEEAGEIGDLLRES